MVCRALAIVSCGGTKHALVGRRRSLRCAASALACHASSVSQVPVHLRRCSRPVVPGQKIHVDICVMPVKSFSGAKNNLTATCAVSRTLNCGSQAGERLTLTRFESLKRVETGSRLTGLRPAVEGDSLWNRARPLAAQVASVKSPVCSGAWEAFKRVLYYM